MDDSTDFITNGLLSQDFHAYDLARYLEQMHDEASGISYGEFDDLLNGDQL